MTLIRFDTTDRGVTAALFQNLLDFVKGTLSTQAGTSHWDDFKPYNTGNVAGGGSSGAAITHRADRVGVIRLAATAGSNANSEATVPSYFDPSKTPQLVVEANVTQNVTANSPQLAVGFSDTAAGSILASADIANGGTQNSLAVIWRANKTFDIVSVVAGTKNALVTGVGVTVDPATTPNIKIGLRVEKLTTTSYRLTPSINGSIARLGAINVVNTKIPEVAMKAFIGTTVSATTAPSIDCDWIAAIDK